MKEVKVLAAARAAVNLLGAPGRPTFRSVSYDPPSPLAIMRGIFGVALVVTALALGLEFVRHGAVNWKLVSLALALWAMFGFATDVYRGAVEPLAGFLHRALFAGGRSITIDEETVFLEQRLADPHLERDREILSAIRLSEIYRKYQYNRPKAEALLDRLLVKYPDARELQVARLRPS